MLTQGVIHFVLELMWNHVLVGVPNPKSRLIQSVFGEKSVILLLANVYLEVESVRLWKSLAYCLIQIAKCLIKKLQR